LKFWRITTKKYALDRSCYGARSEGGRWNPIGFPVLYAGATVEICALEKFVHLAGTIYPPLVLVAVELPDDASLIARPKIDDLPSDWADLPAPESTQIFGRETLVKHQSLVMLIPSAIIPEALNAVINADHPAYDQVKLSIEREFRFDARMRK
jgi:RES domain-containing protein